MKFRRAVQRYGKTPEPTTPYQRAAQAWDERIGSARVQARNWRLMALGGLALSVFVSAGLVWQSLQSRLAPYVVEVDSFGDARAVAPLPQGYRPSDPQIAWHLGRFVTDIRSVTLDPVLMRQNWLSAFDFVTDRGAKFLGGYARGANPFGQVGSRTVSVQVTSVVRASDNSFQVKWVESLFERGNLVGREHWTAMLTVVLKLPASAEVLRKNPLGLYVDAIDWSQELEPTPLGSAAPSSRPSQRGDDALPLGSPLDPGIAEETTAAPRSERSDR